MDHEPVLIDEVMLRQRAYHPCAALGQDVLTRMLLQPGDLLRSIPLISVELVHSVFCRVFETTYLCMLFILPAKPASSFMGRPAFAKLS
jgi:hypothetical protein